MHTIGILIKSISILRITPSIQLISHHPPAFPPHRYASTDSACPTESVLAELTPTPLELDQFHALANYTLDHILFSLEALCDLSSDMPPTNVKLSDRVLRRCADNHNG
ncbi:hypothetical protein BDZ91DRAFT_336985 [Kalaharituber pfeilii]|nr:hypothetical protein BDZ91DRAFT_336985 [Kalaharituber pfeilii]